MFSFCNSACSRACPLASNISRSYHGNAQHNAEVHADMASDLPALLLLPCASVVPFDGTDLDTQLFRDKLVDDVVLMLTGPMELLLEVGDGRINLLFGERQRGRRASRA